MSNPAPFNCYLIGGDTLLAQCGELILERGHQIDGVITSSPDIEKWAAGHNIKTIPADAGYAAVLTEAQFDYLFAITHLSIIPDEAVNSAAKMAVNFHDGPLPAYAGLNAPMWALIQGETNYAITWHAMTTGIDKGDVLLQQPVSIDDNDTALSLNTKCFAAALESFPTLLQQLESGSTQPVPQRLENRSYFGRNHKPAAAGLLDWQQDAATLERLVRALNTGQYENTLASAKALLNEKCFIVDQVRVADDAAQGAPGTLIEVTPNAITVATATGALTIEHLRRLDGQPITLEQAISDSGISQGQMLPAVDVAQAEALQGTCTRFEPALARNLAGVEAIALPYRANSAKAARSDERGQTDIAVPQKVAELAEGHQAIAAAFLLFLARTTGPGSFSVAAAGGNLNEDQPQLQAMAGCHGFVNVSTDPAASARSNLESAAQRLNGVLEQGPWLRDLVAREPNLRNNALLTQHAVLPAAVIVGDTCSADAAAAELVLHVTNEGTARLIYSKAAYPESSIQQLVSHLENLLRSLAAKPDAPFSDLSLTTASDRQRLLEDWNETQVDYDRSACLHTAFAAQAARTPEAIAIADAHRQVTYAELNAQADRLAAHLQQMGVSTETLVGVHVPRSAELMTATLAILKAGAAYVPLDPAFPAERLEFMIADSAMPVIVTHSRIAQDLPATDARLIYVDEALGSADAPQPVADPARLAYVIYTSGSTGRPKGVMIEHRNVINFFAGMDERVPDCGIEPRVWMAVTSLSFDISVLELFWTLTRGFKVVIYDESRARGQDDAGARPQMKRAIDLGLFMWGNDDAPGKDKYRLLIEGAKYFDANGYAAVWTPERHFHAFGGPYPNPAVTGAAVAAVTEHVKIRAGSCVVPLHHPVRIAEEWAVVDNLSGGRVEIAAASGWNPNDFVLRPENHVDNKQVMYDQLEQVRKLWRGESVAFPGPLGHDVEIQSLPRPVQAELPCWITTAGNPETWRQAGALGLNVLTHLLGQSVPEVAEKIRVYREARAEAGYDPASGRVALMLHTFVGEDNDDVRELVREPMKSYLASSMKLAMDYAWSFPAFKRPGGADAKPDDVDLKSLSEEETDTILNFAFERYFETSGLFGDIDTCVDMLARCSAAGVDEIACLLDFGVDTQAVMDSLPRLTAVKDQAAAQVASASTTEPRYSFAQQAERHGITHMQCTPSSARMLITDDESRVALARIPNLLLGGEALPLALAQELKSLLPGTLTNMYGPTETTIWSLTQPIETLDHGIAIGRPIANTQVYVLDKYRQPTPIGVPGELYIGGDGVARGYLNRPELTAERFLDDPFRGDGARMYATGDLVCYREDGLLDFLGRTDFQVKVRGYRIELGEIEHRLESQDSVAEAAVVVRADDEADQRLVAYVVGRSGTPDSGELRQALRTALPDYMVPNEFITLPDMPRTANGKLDRKALLELKPVQPRRVVEEDAPASGTEKLVADLWKKTLRLDVIGLNENFFDLGGHSLLVVQLHGQLKQALDRPISLTDLYQYPTISSLANYLCNGDGNVTVKKATSRGERRRAMRQRRAS